MNDTARIMIIVASVINGIFIVIVIVAMIVDDLRWTYKGQNIKSRAQNLLSSRWLHCRDKPLGVRFCSQCGNEGKCIEACKKDIQLSIDESEAANG